MNNKNKITYLKDELESVGANLNVFLDTVVFRAAQERAMDANNEGVDAQLDFILSSGWSAVDIIFHVRKEASECVRLARVRAAGEDIRMEPSKYRVRHRINEYFFYVEWLNLHGEPKWYILIGTNREPCPWFGEYDTPEAALEAWKDHYIHQQPNIMSNIKTPETYPSPDARCRMVSEHKDGKSTLLLLELYRGDLREGCGDLPYEEIDMEHFRGSSDPFYRAQKAVFVDRDGRVKVLKEIRPATADLDPEL